MRDGLAVRAERGGVALAITDVLLLDPVLGVRRTSIGVDGRPRRRGRPRRQPRHDGRDRRRARHRRPRSIDGRGLVATPGRRSTAHVHWLSPQICDAALAGGLTTLVIQDFGPVWNLGCNPEEGLRATWAALEAHPLNACLLVRASSSRARARSRTALRAGGGGLKIHEDVGAGPEQLRCALDVADAPRRPARGAHRRHERAALGRGHDRRRPPAAPGTPSTSRAAAAGTGPTRSRSPGASASSPRRRRRPCRSASTPRPSTSRWCRRCTCSRPGVVHGDSTIVRHRVRAADDGRRGRCCTTSA